MYKYLLFIFLIFSQAGLSKEQSFDLAWNSLAEEKWDVAKNNIEIIESKADKNYLLAIYYLSKMNPDFDFEKGFGILNLASKSGSLEAKYGLLKIYLKGIEPQMKKDFDKAGEIVVEVIDDLQQSAKDGDTYATWTLAFLFDNGIGVKKDRGKAFKIYQLLHSKVGDIEATYELARRYYYGDGVDKDLLKSKELLILLAKEDYLNSNEMLKMVNKDLNGRERKDDLH